MVHVFCPKKDQKQWELIDPPINRQDKIEWFESLEDFPVVHAPLLYEGEQKEVNIYLSQENVGWVEWDKIAEYPGTTFLTKSKKV